MAKMFESAGLGDMLSEFARYAASGDGLGKVWECQDKDIYEKCKLMTIDVYLQTCEAMIRELRNETASCLVDYDNVEIKDTSD